MSRTYIPKALRQKVAAQARYRCGYCLSREAVIGMALDVEHIIPEALDGWTLEYNLWLACKTCNQIKGTQITGLDPLTGQFAPLFNPREQQWREHFIWNEAKTHIIGQTLTGRGTVFTLQLNREILVEARKLWVSAGLHPPED